MSGNGLKIKGYRKSNKIKFCDFFLSGDALCLIIFYFIFESGSI